MVHHAFLLMQPVCRLSCRMASCKSTWTAGGGTGWGRQVSSLCGAVQARGRPAPANKPFRPACVSVLVAAASAVVVIVAASAVAAVAAIAVIVMAAVSMAVMLAIIVTASAAVVVDGEALGEAQGQGGKDGEGEDSCFHGR